MDLVNLVSSIPTVLLPFIIVFYFYNQNNITWMKERKELIDAILSERKERLQEQGNLIERQFGLVERVVKETESIRFESQSMRNKLDILILRLENHFFGQAGRSDE